MHLDALQHKITVVLDCRLDMVVLPPEDFIWQLKLIAGQLPRNLYLPYDSEKDLLKLYRTLTVVPIPHSRGILVVVVLHLLDTRVTFDLYRVIKLNVYYPGMNLTAKYKLQSDRFAISKDRQWVMFPTREEFQECAQKAHDFCIIRSAQYNVKNYRTDCLMNLFLKDKFSEVDCPISV